MTIIETSQLTIEQKKVIYRLWNNEYPEKLAFKAISDLENYVNSLSEVRCFFYKMI